ncbi:hypothetical protein HDR58_02450 [bacterium]|nr:hypothetical protein [bacterium]
MGYLDNLRSFLPFNTGNVSGPKKSEQTQQATQTQQSQQTAETKHITDNMTDLEIKAEMNKALGFEKQAPVKAETNYAKIDAEFAKDPLAFAAKFASPEVKENAALASVDYDAQVTVMRTLSPERQEQVVAGFSQRNESPRAFTGEFLDTFVA